MTTNLTGIGKSIVKNISLITQENDSQFKITPVGFLRALLENPTTTQISNLKEIQDGHNTSLKFRYLKRGVESDVTDRDDCELNLSPIWGECEIKRPFFSKIALGLSNSQIRDMEAIASGKVVAGQQEMLYGLYVAILSKVNALVQKINKNLLTEQILNFGVNIVSGGSNPQIINFANSPSMEDGIVKIIRDFQKNEQVGTPIIVGNGKVFDYNMVQGMKRAADSGGFFQNPTYLAYEDFGSVDVWGADHFGVFAKGSAGFVDFNMNVGGFANDTGNSVEFTMPIPMTLASGELSSLLLDAQLIYSDCNKYDEDGDLVTAKGWGIILSKSYGLYSAPSDLYQSEDRLFGVNGAFHYVGA